MEVPAARATVQPGQGGLNSADMLGGKLKAVLLLNIEPAFDAANPVAAMPSSSIARSNGLRAGLRVVLSIIWKTSASGRPNAS